MKKIIIMLLTLLAIGIVSAASIHLYTDMTVDNCAERLETSAGNWTPWRDCNFHRDGNHYVIEVTNWVAEVEIIGHTFLSCTHTINVDPYFYHDGDVIVIERYYDKIPDGGDDTPITQ